MKHFSSSLFSLQRMCKALVVASVLLITPMAYAADINLAGVDYNIDTIRQFIAGPGCEYLQTHMVRASDGTKPLDVYFLRVNVTNPYVRMEQVLGKDKVIGTERLTAMMARKSTPTSVFVGGVNGDFFQTKGDVGTPIGLTIGNNEFAFIGHPHYKIGTVREDGRPEIGNSSWLAADPQVTWVYTGKMVVGNDTFPIHHVNYHRYENELVLYNHYQGESTATNDYGSEAVLSLLTGEKWTTSGKMKAKVESVVANAGNTTIEADKFVLSGHGTMKTVVESLKADDEVEIIYSLVVNGRELQVAQCVSGHQTNLMVDNGVVVTENFWDELHPRTGYGYSQTGDTIMFCVVDGRGKSIGCNTQVLGAIMRHYGAWYALNWDGGGSSCLAINHFGPMNDCSDGTERAVANAMFVVAEVPEDDQTIVTIRPYETAFEMPRYGIYVPKFYGYNQYGVMVDPDVKGVKLTCDPSMGEIQSDSSYFASGTQSGMLHANYNDAKTSIDITLHADAPISFRLDSVLVDNRESYEVEVVSQVGLNTIVLSSVALDWEVEDETIATVNEKGEVLGVANGTTRVIGTVGTFIDTLLVHVENPIEPVYTWSTFAEGWNVRGSSKYNPTFSDSAVLPITITFDYSKTLGAFIQLDNETPLYGLPDSIRFAFKTDAEIAKLTISLHANNDDAQLLITADSIHANTDFVTTAAVKDLLTTVEHACYPIWIKYIKFNLAGETVKGKRTITLTGITLLYDDVEVTYLDQTTMPLWQVYPNPVENGILQVVGQIEGSTSVLYDLQGRELIRIRDIQDNSMQINMEAYPAGQYLLKIDNQTVKIIKK